MCPTPPPPLLTQKTLESTSEILDVSSRLSNLHSLLPSSRTCVPPVSPSPSQPQRRHFIPPPQAHEQSPGHIFDSPEIES
eukprot:758247-Hanusia_phi.AAC.2